MTQSRVTIGEDTAEALRFAADAAREDLAGLGDAKVHGIGAEHFGGSLPEEGDGALEALGELATHGASAATASSGPRFFHFVTGGSTPAALGADWLASAFDQSAFAWVASPLGSRLEAVALDWLKELFELPSSWGGVLTTGATMANFAGLAAARQWWGEQHGLDVARDGLTRAVPVFSSGYVHSTALKALAMLGIGRASMRTFSRDEIGRLDADGLEAALGELAGAPAILIGNAGDVNTGDFDPLEAMADLAERYGAWLHVDGAFGLFARLTPRASALAAGVERADSVIADGHKWLNVPYDCGFAFVRDRALLAKVFALDAAYLPSPDDRRPNFGFLGPESSRRARGLAVWATLRAYGRSGYRELVERNLALAQRIASRVDHAPDLQRLADVPLNIVCFRYRPDGRDEAALDELNRRLGEAILEHGRVYVGTTVYRGHVAFRPAVVNWRTTEEDVDLLVDVVRELGARLA
jgi:glutamate/tyrosine decarboxylase-like PLP-dependent enzyme